MSIDMYEGQDHDQIYGDLPSGEAVRGAPRTYRAPVEVHIDAPPALIEAPTVTAEGVDVELVHTSEGEFEL